MDDQLRSRLIEALLGKPLISNAFRGTLVEAIIAGALEPEWRWRADGWGRFDFEASDGTGLEVKQSAVRQDWHNETSTASKCQFDIAERSGHFADDDGRWIEAPGRAASIYVFAHHPIFDPTLADHREPSQWEFYVVPAAVLPRQKSIGFSGVRKLADPVRIDDLLESVRCCRARVF